MSIKGHQPSLLMPKEFGKNVFLRVSSREKKRFSGPGSAEIRSRGRKSKIVAKQSPISQVKSFKLSWLSIASILEQKESKLHGVSEHKSSAHETRITASHNFRKTASVL